MEASRESSKPAAAAEIQRLRLAGNGEACTREQKSSRTSWSVSRGGALVFWLILGMHILDRRHYQGVHAAATTNIEAEELQHERGETPTQMNLAATPTFKEKLPQRNWTTLRPFWGTASPSLPVLPFASQPDAVHAAWASRAANVARRGGAESDGKHAGSGSAAPEKPLPRLWNGSAAKEYGLGSEELQTQCAKLNLNCSYIQKWLFQHPGEKAKWNETTRAAMSTGRDKTAALAQKGGFQQATNGVSVRTDEEAQSRRLTEEMHRLLEGLVAQPLQGPHLHANMRGSNSTQENVEAANHPLADEAEKERIGAEATETEHGNDFAAADAVSRPRPAGADRISLRTAEDEKPLTDQEGSENDNTLLEDAADSEKIHLLLSEAINSLKQNKALQELLELPLYPETAGAEAEDGRPAIVGKFVEDDAEIHEDESRPGDLDDGQTVPGHTAVFNVIEGNEEDILGDAGAMITSSASPAVNHRGNPFQISHRTVRSMTGVAADAAADHETTRSPKTLTVSQLETLLRTRSQRQRRRSPSRPMIFPSCYFDAPTQKRMRAKASVLTAALEQLNDAVEALTELGEVVEKQAEVVEKAAFTLVYRDRLVGEPIPPTKPLVAGDVEKAKRKSDLYTRHIIEKPLRAPVKHTRDDGVSTAEERQEPAPAPELTPGHDTNGGTAEGQQEFQNMQVEDDKYNKLVGANGVRKQLRELFATWELARRAAGASEMANEIMRRAETLRREFVMPLQQYVQQLNFLDASLNPRHIAMQRLIGCKGFIKAVRRTVSRAEEDLYNLGAHAFASEVSLPLMAHDLQQHLADLLEHVVQLQLQHHRALHMRAASLKALHRSFFKSARTLHQDATERLKDTRLLLATSAEEWHKLAQHLGAGVFDLRMELARQLVALRSVDKKAARLEGILNFLQGGLEHLLQVEGQLQQIRKNSRMRHYWLVLDDEEINNEVRAHNEANGKTADESMDGPALFEQENDVDATGLASGNSQYMIQPDTANSGIPFWRSRVVGDAEEALLLELPPQIEEKSGVTSINKDASADAPEQDEEKSMKILQRLLIGVTQMWEYLQMYKRQSSDAEHLLRSRFYVAQESVQKATLVAQTVMALSLMLDRKQQEQSLREKLPFLVQSIQRQELARAQAEAAVEDSVAHVQQLNRKVRFLDAALSFIEGSAEENPATGREVVARIDRINNRLFLNIHPDAEESKRSHEASLHQEENDAAEEASSEGSVGATNGGNTTEKDSDTTHEMLDSELVSALEALQAAQYQHAQRKQELETLEAALRQNRMSLEVHLRILDEIREAGDPRLSRITSARNRRGLVQVPTAESVEGHSTAKNYVEPRKGQHILATGGSLAAAADALAAVAARGKKYPVPRRTPGLKSHNKKRSTLTGASALHRMSHMEQKTARQDGA